MVMARGCNIQQKCNFIQLFHGTGFLDCNTCNFCNWAALLIKIDSWFIDYTIKIPQNMASQSILRWTHPWLLFKRINPSLFRWSYSQYAWMNASPIDISFWTYTFFKRIIRKRWKLMILRYYLRCNRFFIVSPISVFVNFFGKLCLEFETRLQNFM